MGRRQTSMYHEPKKRNIHLSPNMHFMDHHRGWHDGLRQLPHPSWWMLWVRYLARQRSQAASGRATRGIMMKILLSQNHPPLTTNLFISIPSFSVPSVHLLRFVPSSGAFV